MQAITSMTSLPSRCGSLDAARLNSSCSPGAIRIGHSASVKKKSSIGCSRIEFFACSKSSKSRSKTLCGLQSVVLLSTVERNIALVKIHYRSICIRNRHSSFCWLHTLLTPVIASCCTDGTGAEVGQLRR